MRFSGPECLQIDGGWGCDAPDLTEKPYSAHDPIAGFHGKYRQQRNGRMGRKKGREEGKRGDGELGPRRQKGIDASWRYKPEL